MEKRHKLNVTIKGISVKKLAVSRGVEVLVVFNCRDIINQEQHMLKRYEITNRDWYNRLVLDYCKIGIIIDERRNLEDQLRMGIGKSVLITYLDKGNGYSTIFFESEGVDDDYKSMSVDDVLQSVLAKVSLPGDNDFMDDDDYDDEPMSKEEFSENINF